jgi:GH43 family beta-xylosidase
VFERNDAAGVYGSGTPRFLSNRRTAQRDWIVYHGQDKLGIHVSRRTTRAQKFTWNADGTPNFGMPLSLETVLRNRREQKSKTSDFLWIYF